MIIRHQAIYLFIAASVILIHMIPCSSVSLILFVSKNKFYLFFKTLAEYQAVMMVDTNQRDLMPPITILS